MNDTKAKKMPKIVMVNSFKGGAGKTSTALSLAISSSMDEVYENNYYLDIDILGTGMDYLFWGENKPEDFHFFNEYKGDKLEDVFHFLEFKHNDKLGTHGLRYALSDTPTETGTNSGGKIRRSKHILENKYTTRILKLIDKIYELNINSLLVIDCSPGLSSFEVELLESIYRKFNDKFEIRELYITTPDSAHVNKTITCLAENLKFWKYSIKRKPIVIINDSNGFDNLNNGDEEIINDTVNGVRERFKSLKFECVIVIPKRYNKDILLNNAYNKRVDLRNNVSTYALIKKDDIYQEVLSNV
jgi:MinD-like ATPase involved in chromosome partitioning or flagellar assembly